jgi:hypothetical protein
MKLFSLPLIGIMMVSASAGAAPPAGRSVSLTQDPLIMRLNKDEFRIAFGINGERCGGNGCSGIIYYRVDWKTADGTPSPRVRPAPSPWTANTSIPPKASKPPTSSR